MTRKPSQADYRKFWSVFEAKQQRKREQLKTIPPSSFTDQQKGNDHGETIS